MTGAAASGPKEEYALHALAGIACPAMSRREKKKPEQDASKEKAVAERGDAAESDSSSWRPPLGAQSKVLLAMAAVVAVAGACLWGFTAVSAPGDRGAVAAGNGEGVGGGGEGPAAPESGLQPQGFLPEDSDSDVDLPDWFPGESPGGDSGTGSGGGAEQAPEREQTVLEDASPAIFRLGLSFMVGFAMAYAVRTFVKISLIAVGVFFLALFGLDYAGLVTINMGAIEQHYDSLMAFLSREFDSFRSFVTGYLPSATSAGAGMVFGFRRK